MYPSFLDFYFISHLFAVQPSLLLESSVVYFGVIPLPWKPVFILMNVPLCNESITLGQLTLLSLGFLFCKKGMINRDVEA